jgi:hypothetical protein
MRFKIPAPLFNGEQAAYLLIETSDPTINIQSSERLYCGASQLSLSEVKKTNIVSRMKFMFITNWLKHCAKGFIHEEFQSYFLQKLE